jgi:hypothetical protein
VTSDQLSVTSDKGDKEDKEDKGDKGESIKSKIQNPKSKIEMTFDFPCLSHFPSEARLKGNNIS